MYVSANTSCVVGWQGHRVRLVRGQMWHADDPFVKANGGLFSAEVVAVAHSPGYEPVVEQATRAPGEKRATRRPSGRDDASSE